VFFSSKYILFHNSNIFGSCIIHILYTVCAKIKKKNSGAKRLNTAHYKSLSSKICRTTYNVRGHRTGLPNILTRHKYELYPHILFTFFRTTIRTKSDYHRIQNLLVFISDGDKLYSLSRDLNG